MAIVACAWHSFALEGSATKGVSTPSDIAAPRRKRRKFTNEFKAQAVKLCAVRGRSVAQVAADLDVSVTSLREWMKRSEGVGKKASNVLAPAERDELGELRERVKRLEMEREQLRLEIEREHLHEAAAGFANESALGGLELNAAQRLIS